MPYVNDELVARWRYVGQEVTSVVDEGGITPGELNFLVTQLADTYLNFMGLNYTHLNDVIGVLEAAKLELYRRVAVPYEDTKLKENGEVYSLGLLGEGAGSPEHLAVAKVLYECDFHYDFKEAKFVQDGGVRRNPETGAREVWTGDHYVAVEG